MSSDHHAEGSSRACEIVDFDTVMLQACNAEILSDLLREARLVAGVFAPGGDAVELLRLADQLSSGFRDDEMDRAHARRLAAALKQLAREGCPHPISGS